MIWASGAPSLQCGAEGLPASRWAPRHGWLAWPSSQAATALARLLWVEVEGPATEHLSSASGSKPVLLAAPRWGRLGHGAGPATTGLEAKIQHICELNMFHRGAGTTSGEVLQGKGLSCTPLLRLKSPSDSTEHGRSKSDEAFLHLVHARRLSFSSWLQRMGQMEAFRVEALQSGNSLGWSGAQPRSPSASHPAKALATQGTRPPVFQHLRSGDPARRGGAK